MYVIKRVCSGHKSQFTLVPAALEMLQSYKGFSIVYCFSQHLETLKDPWQSMVIAHQRRQAVSASLPVHYLKHTCDIRSE